MKTLFVLLFLFISANSVSQDPIDTNTSNYDSINIHEPDTLNPNRGNTIMIGNKNFTPSNLINGGNYFSFGYARKLFKMADLELQYLFDVVPKSFKDNFMSLSFTYRSGRYSSIIAPSVSLIYMKNLSNSENSNHLGLRVCIATGLLDGNKGYIEAFGVSLLADYGNKDYTFCYELINLGIKF